MYPALDVISEREFRAALESEYRQSELDDIAHEREREIIRRPELRRLPRILPRLRTRIRTSPLPLAPIVAAASLAGNMGPLLMALSDGMTVRGWYNLSVASSVTVATGIADVQDLHTSNNDYVQATGSKQPAYTTGISAIKGRSASIADGTDDRLDTTYVTPAPGTTPVYTWAVVNQVTWTAGRVIISSLSTTQSLCLWVQNPTTPGVRGNNGTALSHAGPTLNTWNRWEAQWQNSTSDYLKIGSVNATGTNMGNTTAANGRTWHGGPSGNYSNSAIACLLQTEGTAPARLRTFLDYWVTRYFGPGMV